MEKHILWTVYYLILQILALGGFCGVTVSIRNKETWRIANSYCSRFDGTLLGGSSKGDYMQLQNILKITQWKNVWTDIKAKRFGALTWLNGSSIEGRKFHRYDAKCGCLDLFDMELYEYLCQQSFNFLCESPSCEECSKSNRNEACVAVAGSCYFVSTSSATWYEARSTCRSQGRDLAVIDTNAHINRLIDAIRRPFSIQSLWLGVRTIDWFANDKDTWAYHWLVGQPDVSNDCVVLTRQNQIFDWKTYNCNETANFACKLPETSSSIHLDNSSSTTSSRVYKKDRRDVHDVPVNNKVSVFTVVILLVATTAIFSVVFINKEKISTICIRFRGSIRPSQNSSVCETYCTDVWPSFGSPRFENRSRHV